MTRLPLLLSLIFLASGFLNKTQATPYFEAGTSVGSYSKGQNFFGSANADSGSGFLGSFSFYVPVTSIRNFFHFDLGLQNRVFTTSDSQGSPIAMGSSEISLRLEISRFYVGGGYAPITFVSNTGLTGLHTNPGASGLSFRGRSDLASNS